MTVAVGPMQLLATEPNDVIEDYVNGLQPDGGEWTNWERLSAHDHSGGLMGPAVAVTIPPGSITSGQLDPSVLAPYALLDGSKPFTGTVVMQADAVVRDRLSFGEQGTALAPDAYWERAGVNALRTGSNVGIGVAPEAWAADTRAVQIGQGGAVYGITNQNIVVLSNNTRYDAGANTALAAGASAQINLDASGALRYYTAPAVAAGAAQTFTTRLTVDQAGNTSVFGAGGSATLGLRAETDADTSYTQMIFGRAGTNRWRVGENIAGGNSGAFDIYDDARARATLRIAKGTGTVTLTPDAGNHALTVSTGDLYHVGTLPLAAAGMVEVQPIGGAFRSTRDNGDACGTNDRRWTVVCAVSGTISTSSAEMKEAITPLDPAAALAAVLATDPVVFDYKPPVRDASWYELPEDLEQAERVLLDRMTNEPLMAAARHQAGFVLSDATGEYQTDPLFETGEGQSNAANSVGVLLAALHEIDRRLIALEEGTPA